MELTVTRLYKKNDYTIGQLKVDGYKFCDTLEDRVRDLKREKKVYGETAIPEGRYRVIMTFSPKFKRQMPLLCAVPYFEAIRIHAGNRATDSAGCILVGENKIKGGLINSRMWSDKLNELINEAVEREEKVYITIK